jgi:DNA-binding GntR family transcriptional regulator
MSFAHLAYDHIRSKLSKGAVGGGELSEPVLARELGMSRTPVREAIRRLESEGLLEQRPKQGTYVRRPDRRELAEIYQLRLLLEPFAAARAAQHATAESLAELESLLRGMFDAIEQSRPLTDEAARDRLLAEHAAKDTQFHQTIVRVADNRRILKAVSDANVLAMAMSFPKDSPHGALPSMARAYREHKKILQAIKRHDPAGAESAMRHHLERARQSTLEYFDHLEKQRPALPDSTFRA